MPERSFGWKKSRDSKLWKLEKEYEPVIKTYPQVADLRCWDSPVGNQLNESDCVLWMLKAMMENIMIRLKLAFVSLSPQYPYYWVRMAEGSWPQDAGCMILDAVKVAAKWGFPADSDWPYKDTDYNKFPPPEAFIAKKHLVSSYYAVPQRLEAICTCIGTDLMPVGNGIQIFENFPMDGSTKGIVPMPQGNLRGGHGVPYVGYNLNKDETPSPTMPGKKIPGYSLILKNSWGTVDCGDDGYFYIPLDFALNPELASEQVEILKEV